MYRTLAMGGEEQSGSRRRRVMERRRISKLESQGLLARSVTDQLNQIRNASSEARQILVIFVRLRLPAPERHGQAMTASVSTIGNSLSICPRSSATSRSSRRQVGNGSSPANRAKS